MGSARRTSEEADKRYRQGLTTIAAPIVSSEGCCVYPRRGRMPSHGFPGLPGWGAKSATTVLARYVRLESIPKNAGDWDLTVRGAARLTATLAERYDDAVLFRDLATLRADRRLFTSVDALRWQGPRPEFEPLFASMNAKGMWARAGAIDTVR